jgi:hypothetical protein
VHGRYHTHAGFWAGDNFAVADFRDWLGRKYDSSEKFRHAWGENVREINRVRPFLQDKAPSDRAWIDMIDWYTESMTNYAKFWLTETRKNFPNGKIYLCTGGHAPPEHGADFGEQCKIAAQAGAGVRITNESSDYRTNFSATRWVASAARQYGAFFSFEPAGPVDSAGLVARIYNATASGAVGLHCYFGNLFTDPQSTENFIRWGSEFTQRGPITELAVYYPSTHIKLHGSNPFLNAVKPLRDRFDFAYASDKQILDGGLKNVRALIFLLGSKYEGTVLEEIRKWQSEGGLLIYADGLGRVATVEGEESASDILFGEEMIANGNVAVFHGDPTLSDYRDFICRAVTQTKKISPGTLAMILLDGKEDGLFATLTKPDELLWFNSTDREAIVAGTRILPRGIAAQEVRGK